MPANARPGRAVFGACRGRAQHESQVRAQCPPGTDARRRHPHFDIPAATAPFVWLNRRCIHQSHSHVIETPSPASWTFSSVPILYISSSFSVPAIRATIILTVQRGDRKKERAIQCRRKRPPATLAAGGCGRRNQVHSQSCMAVLSCTMQQCSRTWASSAARVRSNSADAQSSASLNTRNSLVGQIPSLY